MSSGLDHLGFVGQGFHILPQLAGVGNLTDEERDELAKKAAKMAVLLKAPERVQAVCADIAQHFEETVAPEGFGAQVVTFDRQSCLLYKQALDRT